MLEFMEIVPGIGGAIKYDSNALGVIAQMGADIPKALGQAIEMVDWKNKSEKELTAGAIYIATVAGNLYGIPATNQIKKSIKAALRGGNPYQIIAGIYIKEEKKKKYTGRPSSGVRRPRISRP